MCVLVGCECSGVVRWAFRALGHDAWSCDLQSAEDQSPHHIVSDVLLAADLLPWDLGIFHPPCTHLACSGARYFKQKIASGLLENAADLFLALVRLELIPRICVENPIGIMSTRYRKPDQIIQPWQFGHPEPKATCLWLKGLPKLVPTHVLWKPACGYWDNQTPSGQNKLGPSPDRAQRRSRTYEGIAQAMAEQWGGKV